MLGEDDEYDRGHDRLVDVTDSDAVAVQKAISFLILDLISIGEIILLVGILEDADRYATFVFRKERA